MDRRIFLKYSLAILALPTLPQATLDNSPPQLIDLLPRKRHENRVTLVAIGRTGIELVRSVEKDYYGLHKIVAISPVAEALQASNADTKLLTVGSLGLRPATPDMARTMALEYRDEIENAISDAHRVLIVAALGGVTGGSVAGLVAEVAGRRGVMSQSLVYLPFAWEKREGISAQHSSFAMIDELRSHLSNVTVVSNEQLGQWLGSEATMDDFYDETKRVFKRFLLATTGTATQSGFAGIDSEDYFDAV